MVFRVQKERYALPLAAVREVVNPPPSYGRVPKAPPAVRGVMNLRGRVVTVVELARLLELPSADGTGQQILLLDRGRRDLGLLVSEVEGIESLDRVSPNKDATPGLLGLARVRGWAVAVMDPDGLDAAVTQMVAGRLGANLPVRS